MFWFQTSWLICTEAYLIIFTVLYDLFLGPSAPAQSWIWTKLKYLLKHVGPDFPPLPVMMVPEEVRGSKTIINKSISHSEWKKLHFLLSWMEFDFTFCMHNQYSCGCGLHGILHTAYCALATFFLMHHAKQFKQY